MKRLDGTKNCLSIFDKCELLVTQDQLEGSLQKLVPFNLRQTILRLAPHTTLSGNSAEYRMYDSLRCDNYWPDMTQTFKMRLNPAQIILKWKQDSVMNANMSYFHQAFS